MTQPTRALRRCVRRRPWAASLAMAVAATLAGGAAFADGGVVYQDIAADPESGVTYSRVASDRNIIAEVFEQPGVIISSSDLQLFPQKPGGAPGVAIFDYDGDGDLDVYVTNGPGAANSLYSNQLMETGAVSFVDRATDAGVDALEQDSSGVCFGDIDNDGDHDLYVLGAIEPNRLYENQGNGTFADISEASGTGGSFQSSASCAMGDVDGDGLLDIVVGNSYTDWSHFLGIFEPFQWNEHNDLYLNTGGNVFVESSAAAGLRDLAGLPPPAAGSAGLTWSVLLVDYDLDGDVDLVSADDQGVVPAAKYGGLDRGFVRLFENDGSGSFADVTAERGLTVFGNWHGLSAADFNCDRRMDLFASGFGDYTPTTTPFPYELGDSSSRWFLGQAGGGFTAPGVGDLVATPFGWGNASFDYDNDGDADVVFHGGIKLPNLADTTNPGVVLQNAGCSADFAWDTDALAGSTDHSRRLVEGLAVGDLDGNGFVDVVTASGLNVPAEIPLFPLEIPYGSPFDATATIVPIFAPLADDPNRFAYTGVGLMPGNLSVEMASANDNNWLTVHLMGTAGITAEGAVNRDAIGAVVSFLTPERKRALVPVLGGSSYGSQNSLGVYLGLGEERRGMIDVIWPGGTRNRLHMARVGERIVFPEIPCDIDGDWENSIDYYFCVDRALAELGDAGILDDEEQNRFFISALRGYFEAN